MLPAVMSQFFTRSKSSDQHELGGNEIYGELPDENSPVVLLSRKLAKKDDVKAELQSRLWFTYRKSFAPIGGKGPTSDQGWGCMLRAGQMMLAESLVRLKLGRAFNWPNDKHNETYKEVISLFQDTHQAPCSIQQIALTGATSEKREVGEWFGPNTMAQVMKRICLDKSMGLSVHVAMDSVVSKADVRTEMTRKTTAPVLLVIPLRLGLDHVNQLYIKSLSAFLEHEKCVGIMGGKPNQAHYFVGLQETLEATWLLYLDPHTTQTYNVDEFDESLHTSQMCWMKADRIDPSLAVGFLFDNVEEFESWSQTFQSLADMPFGIVDSASDRLVSIRSTVVAGDSDNSDYEVLDLN